MKAYSKAARRKFRKAVQGVAALYEEFREEAIVQTAEPDEPLRTVREARARQTGKRERDVFEPMLCFDAGRAIDAGARNRDEARAMWRTYSEFDQAHRASVFHATGKHREPNVSRMEFMPERFEVRHDQPPPDMRSEEERHAAAMAKWADCQHKLGQLSGWQRYAITSAFYEVSQLFDRGLTVHGQSFVAAVRALCEVIDTFNNRR
jgi:hypothetical protein